ncbi:nucleoside recognition domain-containing protein [Congregibacter variabilis]|uniref:Nucleoside recognition domain-containing protein n=1 Tax=Congregibacter variabilis TaxID=3081200 RepID=A0ABZ0I4A8_9GAMM|nr:nucleoside recognition domain-containing protein [Congregibacter sp. IMCC43200]
MAALLRFLIPSIAGLLIFLVPLPLEDGLTVLFSLYSDWVNQHLGFVLVEAMVLIAVIGALIALYHSIAKPQWRQNKPMLYAIAEAGPIWIALRIVGAAIALMVYFKVGPEVLRLEDTGIILVEELAIAFSIVLLPACFFMPLLTEFGAMDFFGTLVAPVFRRLFRLPGRAAVDATASFISASTIGILVTGQQYQRGFYTGREAVSVATNFSVVSLPFALVIANVSGVGDYFIEWYLCSVMACIVCAAIVPRLPPVSRIADSYIDGSPNTTQSNDSHHGPLLRQCLNNAISSASAAPSLPTMARSATIMMLEQLFGLMGPLIALGTLTAVVAFHSSIAQWISMPITGVLTLLDVHDAARIAPGFLFGFMDQYIPTIVASEISSDRMRFVLAGLSLCQLIYMTETGLVVLKVGLPVSVLQLFQIFVIRTVIVTPVLAGTAWLLFPA